MTWCFVPYKEINFYVPTGFITYCCKHDFQNASKIEDFSHGKEFLYNQYLHDIKKNLLQGNKISTCKSCWRSEDKGESSWRQTEGVIPDNLNNIKSLDPQKQYYTQIALYFDNTCDMKCVYCGPWLSSKWASEISNIKEKNIKTNYSLPDFEVNHNKDVYNLRIQRIHEFLEALGEEAGKSQDHINLTILGGEPLLSPEIKDSKFLKYIDSFFKKANKDFSLIFTIHTNGNTPKKILDKFLKDVEEAKKRYKNFTLKIIVSIDTVGKTSEYIRAGSNWDTIRKNIDTYCSSPVVDQMGFSPTLSIFSITTIQDIVNYWIDLSKRHNLPINMSVGVVYNPFFMNPYHLTKDYVPYIDKALTLVLENKSCFTELSYNLLTSRFKNLIERISKNETLDDEISKVLSTFLDYSKDIRNQDAYEYIPNMVKLNNV